ncbi:Putative uncharacterized protein FLJ37770 [Araneus ventricosus]|uniref:Mos1 transposase HTH domain-containing protein n=1 Tax=Araneus ventricosus TaxID=182803 RepID=A0A4Y2B4K6_ARAVE|nr:Putative uncharacterized protein FLJ37770 [Araneus ventricosus]
MSSLEQPANIKFCILLEKSPSETLEMLKKAYGSDAIKKTAVYEWHKRFLEGRTNIEDDPRTGPSPLPRQMKMLRAFEKSCVQTDELTVEAIASELGISHGSVHSILHDDLNMHRICLHMVPKMLSPEQKEQCQTQCYHSGTPTLFSRPSTRGFLPVFTTENEIQGTPFCGFR